MTRMLPMLAGVVLALVASPAMGATNVPTSFIPPPVLLELRMLERQFDLALANDCAPERCFSKGCFYRAHVVQDLPRDTSMPGLGQSEGPGSVPPQEYLTEAFCEFTHEKSVSGRDVQVLARRLEQKLSKGWLKVSVGREILETLPKKLAESPNPPEEKPALPPPPPPPEPKPEPKAELPTTWDSAIALRELWVSLLPHFSWMIAVLLCTIAALWLIWGSRRLGRETIEEKAMAAELAASAAKPAEAEAEKKDEAAPEVAIAVTPSSAEESASFVKDQQKIWGDRVAETELARDEGIVVGVLRDWLRDGEFPLLTKAIFTFGDRLSVAFPTDGELAARKVELAEYLRTVDEKTLPSEAEFFRRLNQHAISSSLLAQADAEVYLSLREEFGSSGVMHLIAGLPPRHAALLFAMVPGGFQQDVSRLLTPALREGVADQLLASNRISREDSTYLFEVIQAARAGKPLPPAPAAQGIVDRGREVDAAGAVSVLLPRIEPEARRSLFARALERSGGTFPRWYEDILYPDMLLKLPEEMRKDLLLEVDVRNLAGWTSIQHPTWQEGFLGRLGPAMQKSLRSSMVFASRTDQLRFARHGQQELVAAVKRQLAQGKVTFTDIVA